MTPDPGGAFRALADPTRRAIIAMLADRDMTIAAVAENFAISRPAVKKHLRVLEEGNLITVTASGRERINTLNIDGLHAVGSWVDTIDQFWSNRLARLKSEIEKERKDG